MWERGFKKRGNSKFLYTINMDKVKSVNLKINKI